MSTTHIEIGSCSRSVFFVKQPLCVAFLFINFSQVKVTFNTCCKEQGGRHFALNLMLNNMLSKNFEVIKVEFFRLREEVPIELFFSFSS